MVLESSARPQTRDTHMKLCHIHILPTVKKKKISSCLKNRNAFQKSKKQTKEKKKNAPILNPCVQVLEVVFVRTLGRSLLGCLLACGCCPEVRRFYTPPLPSDPAPAAAPALRSFARGV